MDDARISSVETRGGACGVEVDWGFHFGRYPMSLIVFCLIMLAGLFSAWIGLIIMG